MVCRFLMIMSREEEVEVEEEEVEEEEEEVELVELVVWMRRAGQWSKNQMLLVPVLLLPALPAPEPVQQTAAPRAACCLLDWLWCRQGWLFCEQNQNHMSPCWTLLPA